MSRNIDSDVFQTLKIGILWFKNILKIFLDIERDIMCLMIFMLTKYYLYYFFSSPTTRKSPELRENNWKIKQLTRDVHVRLFHFVLFFNRSKTFISFVLKICPFLIFFVYFLTERLFSKNFGLVKSYAQFNRSFNKGVHSVKKL